jgi:uncharacterized protein YegP (UPF0339 family)
MLLATGQGMVYTRDSAASASASARRQRAQISFPLASRRNQMPNSFAVETRGRFRLAVVAGQEQHFHSDERARFEVYRAEEVSITSTQFCGGDWRWRLRSAAGATLAKGDGYASERACRKAVIALRSYAHTASDEQREFS